MVLLPQEFPVVYLAYVSNVLDFVIVLQKFCSPSLGSMRHTYRGDIRDYQYPVELRLLPLSSLSLALAIVGTRICERQAWQSPNS